MGEVSETYRTAIEQIDLGGFDCQAITRTKQTSANNCSVRVHRAGKAGGKKLKTVCGTCAEKQLFGLHLVDKANRKIVPARTSAAIEEP